MSPPAIAGIDEIVPTVIRKNHNYFHNKFFSIYNYLFRFFFLYSVFNEQFCRRLSAGGDDGIRTHDPLLAGQVLSQLSYTPIKWFVVIISLLTIKVSGRPKWTRTTDLVLIRHAL